MRPNTHSDSDTGSKSNFDAHNRAKPNANADSDPGSKSYSDTNADSDANPNRRCNFNTDSDADTKRDPIGSWKRIRIWKSNLLSQD